MRLMSATGSGLSSGNWTVPFEVLKSVRSVDAAVRFHTGRRRALVFRIRDATTDGSFTE